MTAAPATLKTDSGSRQNTAPAKAGMTIDALTNTTVNDISPVASAMSLKTPLIAVTAPKRIPRIRHCAEYFSPENTAAAPTTTPMTA